MKDHLRFRYSSVFIYVETNNSLKWSSLVIITRLKGGKKGEEDGLIERTWNACRWSQLVRIS